MPPPPRARTAINAMKDLGFSRRLAAHVLKRLLDVYDNKYEYVEENGYQVLIDKILEEQELQANGGQKHEVITLTHPETSRKRLRKLSEMDSTSSDGPHMTLLKEPKLEPDVYPELDLGVRRRSKLVSEQVNDKGKEVEPVSPPTVFVGNTSAHEFPRRENGSSSRGLSAVQPNTSEPTAVNKQVDKGKGKVGMCSIALENRTAPEPVTSQGASTSDIDIASSETGKLKLKLCFNSDRPDLCKPNLDAIVKMVEERCFGRIKVLQPDFSLMKIMKDMCECAMELSTEATEE